MSRTYLTDCPRCGSRSFEVLATHSHCFACLYSPDFHDQPKQPKYMTLREAEEILEAAGIQKFPRLTAKTSGVA
jgi:hypothetical protein